MASSITCIPATRNVFTAIPMTSITQRRVAALPDMNSDGSKHSTASMPVTPLDDPQCNITCRPLAEPARNQSADGP